MADGRHPHSRDAALQQVCLNAGRAAASYEQVRNQAVRQIVVARNALETCLATNEAAAALVLAAQTTYDAAVDAGRDAIEPAAMATDRW